MPASMETKRRLRVIRRLSKSVPDRTAQARLEQIGDIVSGKVDAQEVTSKASLTLEARLVAGQASRSPRSPVIQAAREKREKQREADRKAGDNVQKSAPPEAGKKKKKRDEKGGQDRKEEGGEQRQENVQTSLGTNL